MGALKDRIASDLREAMKARDQLRADTLRSAISGFSYKRGETGREPTDAEELDVLRRLAKQRTDASEEYERAGRAERAEKERAERELLLGYLPRQKSPEEVRAVVDAAIGALPPEGRNQGAVMKSVMGELRGLADGRLVAETVQQALRGDKSK